MEPSLPGEKTSGILKPRIFYLPSLWTTKSKKPTKNGEKSSPKNNTASPAKKAPKPQEPANTTTIKKTVPISAPAAATNSSPPTPNTIQAPAGQVSTNPWTKKTSKSMLTKVSACAAPKSPATVVDLTSATSSKTAQTPPASATASILPHSNSRKKTNRNNFFMAMIERF